MKWILEAALILLVIYILQSINVIAGFPFGYIFYEGVAGPAPFIFAPPLVALLTAIPVLLAFFIGKKYGFKDLAWVFGIGGILMAFSFIFEPLAVKAGLWYYRNGGFFFDVPLSAFVGWLFTGSLLAFLLRKYDQTTPEVGV
jgi:putative membrane protein